MEGAYGSPNWLSRTRLWLLTTVSVNVVASLNLLLPRLVRATAVAGRLIKDTIFPYQPGRCSCSLLLLTHHNAPSVGAFGKSSNP